MQRKPLEDILLYFAIIENVEEFCFEGISS